MSDEPMVAEDVAIARKILLGPSAVIAFCPAGTGVPVWDAMLRVARALGALTRGAVWLCRAPGAGDDPEGDAAGDTLPVRHEALSPRLTAVSMARPRSIGQAVATLEGLGRRDRHDWEHLLVDLTGFLPHVREILSWPDAIVSVAEAGRTKDRELLALVELLPAPGHVGTLVVD